MGFSEKTQAFIVAKYYAYLTEGFLQRGKNAFIHATKHYARQRGSRMAQKAIRDGEELDYVSFCRYGEWMPSEDALDAGTACVMDVRSMSPDFEYHVSICPWHRQFVDMGCADAGRLYCSCLDKAIMQGYNDEVMFETIQTQFYADECIFRVENAGIGKGILLDRIEEYVKGFDYHCAHTYYAYAEIVENVFGVEGKEISRKVLADFRKEYGEEMTGKLMAYEGENFNI